MTPRTGTRRTDAPDADLALSRHIVAGLMAGSPPAVSVSLWDGMPVADGAAARCRLTIRDPGVLRTLVLKRDLLSLAEAYLAGRIDVDGDMEALFGLDDHFQALIPALPWTTRLGLLRRAFTLSDAPGDGTSDRASGRRPAANSRAAIAHHYDVGNDFYALWLDRERVYSCAYFQDPTQSLDDAQRDKLDYICRKLRLAPGQSLLDVGCGWGALACWAARHYGVKVHGITLSAEQHRWATDRVAAQGLTELVQIELKDYRDLAGSARYDRIVSVGMFEHIGVANFPRYFGTMRRLLKPDGLFLNHGITSETGWQKTPLTRFMNRYIFPDGELARIAEVVAAMEQAGFEVADVESLRRHYALTLRHWVARLEAQREQAIACSDERTYLLWRLYMAGCARYFDEGSINLYQLLGSAAHQATPLPLRRDDLYH